MKKKDILIIVLGMLAVSILSIVIYSKVINKNNSEQATTMDKKTAEIEKLKKALEKEGYKNLDYLKNDANGYTKYDYRLLTKGTEDIADNLEIDGTYEYYIINIKNMTIKRTFNLYAPNTPELRSFLTEGYSLSTNTATGMLSNPGTFGSYSYNFKVGNSNCDFDSCTTYINNLIGLKENFLQLLSDNDIDIELLK